jgi:hypothetical protein
MDKPTMMKALYELTSQTTPEQWKQMRLELHRMIQAEKKEPSEAEEITDENVLYWLNVAKRFWNALEERDYLVLRYQNMNEKDVDKTQLEWARELEKIERLDLVEREKIIWMLDWLLRVNTFWVGKGGPLQSLSQLRTLKNGKRKVDTILGQYDEWLEKKGVVGRVSVRPSQGDKFTAYQYKQIIEAYPDLVGQIKKMPVNEANQEYIYV